MKILIIRPITTGGVGYYYETIRNHFRYEVKYIYAGSRKKKEKFFEAGIRILSDYLNFLSEIIKNNYVLVHVNPSLQNNAVIRDGIFLLLSKLFRNKTVVFFHGWDDEFASTIRKRYSKIFGLVYFSADTVIVLASRFKTVLQDMGCTKPIVLETTLVPDEVFDLCKDKQLEKGNPGKLNILFLSRIEKNKGVYEAIEAFIILKKKYTSITMTIAGDGSELVALRSYLEVRNVTDVNITGWLDGENKIQAYEIADIFLFPTYHGEGMPTTILEAMAYGLPVITRPVGGIKDFFLNGEMGFLTESTNPEVLAPLCEIFIRDTERRLVIGQFNRKYAGDHFLASKVCKRLEAIYLNVVHNDPEHKA